MIKVTLVSKGDEPPMVVLVEADGAKVQDGALLLFNEDNELRHAFAPGTWLTLETGWKVEGGER